MIRRPRIVPVAWALLLVAGAVCGQVSERPPTARRTAPEPIPRLPTAARQLAHARGLKGRRQGASDSMKLVWADRAISAYRAVRELHPKVPSSGAEAAFRAGLLFVATARPELGVEELEAAVALGEGTEFRPRARMEIGHVHRRAKRYGRALDAYLELAFDPGDARDHRDDAWLHAGDAWRARGELCDARRAWRFVSAGADDPCTRVFAFDRLGILKLDAGDLEGAADILNECVRSVTESALERTHRGERVRRALANMHLVDELPRQVEARWHEKRRAIGAEKALTTPITVSPHAH